MSPPMSVISAHFHISTFSTFPYLLYKSKDLGRLPLHLYFCNIIYVITIHKARHILKKGLPIPVLLLLYCSVFAQKIDSIYFNLYTDSLKKGTYNYINIIGKLSNGSFRPLDSTQVIFASSYGKFHGNSLWLPFEPAVEKVDITVTSKQEPAQILRHTIYIKKAEDNKNLKTVDEIMAEPPKRPKRGRN